MRTYIWTPADGTPIEASIGYFLDPIFEVDIGNSRHLERRDPLPELLVGSRPEFLAFVHRARTKRTHSLVTVSLARDEIDPFLFNAGDTGSRKTAAAIIRAVIDLAYAGIPEQKRPPVLFATHTHANRVELNGVLPALVRNTRGHVVGFDIHRDEPVFRRDFWRLDDAIALRLGWPLPGSPERRSRLRGPNSLERQRATAQRLGLEITPDRGLLYVIDHAHDIAEGEDLTPSAFFEQLSSSIPRGIIVERCAASIRLRTGRRSVFLQGTLCSDEPPEMMREVTRRRESIKAAEDAVRDTIRARAARVTNRFRDFADPDPGFLLPEILDFPGLALTPHHPAFTPVDQHQPPHPGPSITDHFARLIARTAGHLIRGFAARVVLEQMVRALRPTLQSFKTKLEIIHGKLERRNQSRSDAHADPTASADARDERERWLGGTSSGDDERVFEHRGRSERDSGTAGNDRDGPQPEVRRGINTGSRNREAVSAGGGPEPRSSGADAPAQSAIRRLDVLIAVRVAASHIWPDDRVDVRFSGDASEPALVVSIGDIDGAIKVAPDSVDVDADDHAFDEDALHSLTDRLGEILGKDFTRAFETADPDEDTLEPDF